jgi:hypothetical protein
MNVPWPANLVLWLGRLERLVTQLAEVVGIAFGFEVHRSTMRMFQTHVYAIHCISDWYSLYNTLE